MKKAKTPTKKVFCARCTERVIGEFFLIGEVYYHKACLRCDQCWKILEKVISVFVFLQLSSNIMKLYRFYRDTLNMMDNYIAKNVFVNSALLQDQNVKHVKIQFYKANIYD